MGVRDIAVVYSKGAPHIVAEVTGKLPAFTKQYLEDFFVRSGAGGNALPVLWCRVGKPGQYTVYFDGPGMCCTRASVGDYIILCTYQLTAAGALDIVRDFKKWGENCMRGNTPEQRACLDVQKAHMEALAHAELRQASEKHSRPEQGSTAPVLDGSLKVPYYKLKIEHPLTLDAPYTAECGDVIAALGLTYAEGNIMKALWRIGQHRKGRGKPGGSVKYDRDKIVAMAHMLEKEAQYGAVVKEDDE